VDSRLSSLEAGAVEFLIPTVLTAFVCISLYKLLFGSVMPRIQI